VYPYKIKKMLPQSLKFFLKNVMRIFDVVLMMITLHIFPKQTYRFSTRKFLPSEKFRIKKKELKPIPYKLLVDKSSKLDELDEVDAIGIGSSFNLNKLKNVKKPTYLLSFWDALKIDQYGEISYSSEEAGYGHKINNQKNRKYTYYMNSNITYVVDKPDLIKKFSESGHKVLFVETFIKNNEGKLTTPASYNYYDKNLMNIINHKNVTRISQFDEIIKYPTEKPHPGWTQTGSILPYLSAISFFSKKINVYGWDFFLNKSPDNMNYFELLSNMYKNKIDFARSQSHFEEALIAFYFGYHFSLNQKFSIKSYLGQLHRHESLIKKIEKVFFI